MSQKQLLDEQALQASQPSTWLGQIVGNHISKCFLGGMPQILDNCLHGLMFSCPVLRLQVGNSLDWQAKLSFDARRCLMPMQEAGTFSIAWKRSIGGRTAFAYRGIRAATSAATCRQVHLQASIHTLMGSANQMPPDRLGVQRTCLRASLRSPEVGH